MRAARGGLALAPPHSSSTAQMAAPPLVELRTVTKRFGSDPLVLDRFSLSVQPGEFVSLIGPSGCGKSTLLRLVADLTSTTSGTVSVGGRPPGDATTELAFVFQDPTLLPWLTVARNVELPLKLRGVSAAERAAVRERALDLVGLGEKSDAYPRQLSGGQKMRVSLARALSLSPMLLLLDEPFGALDEMTRERLNEELLQIREQHAWTALFVTHSVAEAVFLSTRVIVLSANPGRIHADIAVPFPYPRNGDLRLRPEFHALVGEVSRELHAAEGIPASSDQISREHSPFRS
jgi:NitT/TauT family transport system ATP-binding protein